MQAINGKNHGAIPRSSNTFLPPAAGVAPPQPPPPPLQRGVDHLVDLIDKLTPLVNEVTYLKHIIEYQGQKIDRLVAMVEELNQGRLIDFHAPPHDVNDSDQFSSHPDGLGGLTAFIQSHQRRLALVLMPKLSFNFIPQGAARPDGSAAMTTGVTLSTAGSAPGSISAPPVPHGQQPQQLQSQQHQPPPPPLSISAQQRQPLLQRPPPRVQLQLLPQLPGRMPSLGSLSLAGLLLNHVALVTLVPLTQSSDSHVQQHYQLSSQSQVRMPTVLAMPMPTLLLGMILGTPLLPEMGGGDGLGGAGDALKAASEAPKRMLELPDLVLKKPRVHIQFIHNPTTVRQIYDEFTKGYAGQPPLAECDQKFGKQKWRGDLRSKELKRYQRRKKLVDAIERGMQKYNKPLDTIIEYIEQFRGDKLLTWIMNGHLPADL